MRFVYIHAVAFAAWMLFVERNPWPKLTLVVCRSRRPSCRRS
jgi:hypothetical protein